MEKHWEQGDVLQIRGHKSATSKGLNYQDDIVTATEPGFSGGWDVFDAIGQDGEEVSFYGFSVRRVMQRTQS